MYPSNRLRELRKQAKLTQGELANLSGLTQSSISQFENDKLPLNFDQARIFARILSQASGKALAAADLMGDQDNPGRLSPEEAALIQRFRAASEHERGFLQKTAEAVVPFHSEDNDNHRAA